jgi:hypothetical protein
MMSGLISRPNESSEKLPLGFFPSGADQCLDARTQRKFCTISFRNMMSELFSLAVRNIKKTSAGFFQ